MTDPERTVHSLTEAHLYAAMLPCRACSTLGLLIIQSFEAGDGASRRLRGRTLCEGCGEESELQFAAPAEVDLRPETVARIPVVINATQHPSELLDPGQWLTLYRIALEAAEKLSDKALARAVRLEAGQCLMEALRFYPADSDIPPVAAFFSAETLRRFRDHPHLFARQRLIDLAATLPVQAAESSAPVSTDRPPSTKWWLR